MKCLWRAILSYISRGARVLAVLFVACGPAEARPLHVRDSTPGAETIVDGRNAQYVVRFDGWVDHAASRMDITENGKIVEPLVPTRDSESYLLALTPQQQTALVMATTEGVTLPVHVQIG
jgi:hypothetical protein